LVDRVVVPVPSREWALCAIEDLRREGMTAELDGEDAGGCWRVKIEGSEVSIAEIRSALRRPREAVSWDAFVNAAVGDDRP
jgi:hypothetical protein